MKSLISAAIVAAALPMAAQAQTYTFETAGTATVTSYSDTQGGVTMTLTRQGGKTFSFSDVGASAPGFGSRSLYPFTDTTAGAFIANFSSARSFFSYQAGDFAPSDDDTLTLSLYSGLNGTGTLVGTTSFFYGASGFPTIATLSLVSSAPFLSAIFNGGSADFPNSVFYDNIIVRPAVGGAVPEPATWAMMLAGFGAVGFAMRRRQQKASVRFA